MMHKFKITLTLFCLFLTFASGFCQGSTLLPKDEKVVIQDKIASFFTAMYQNDSTTLKQLFSNKARLLTLLSQGEVASLLEVPIGEFVAAVGESKTELWLEVIWSYTIEVEGEMASVWCPYTFFLETNGVKQMMHCGVNSFELYRGPIGWQITQITDIRSTGNCRVE